MLRWLWKKVWRWLAGRRAESPEQHLELRGFFQQAWRWKCGKPEEAPPFGAHPPLEELRKTEWNPRFIELMQNRLIMGSFRYYLFRDPRKWTSDLPAGLRKKLAAYEETGNTENLVDIANYALLEFSRPSHPNAHFHADDDHAHCPEKSDQWKSLKCRSASSAANSVELEKPSWTLREPRSCAVNCSAGKKSYQASSTTLSVSGTPSPPRAP